MPYNVIGDVKTLEVESSNVSMGSSCFVLTMDNTVNIQSDITVSPGYQGGDAIVTLPEDMRPTATILIPCQAYSENTNGVVTTYLTISTSGIISWHQTPTVDVVIKTHGIMFNIMDRYYNEAIGNTDSSDWTIPTGIR